ncbi:GntR family transcriptional regulator [Streptomyces sp. NPDC059698]|uniref:GntR family transcriptional regulator n=1 Tax=unclassified Streptomyces TaxID=2593676 RepID=UPI00093D4CF3|nr:GntR family transcriptional regulator [Streptomyces sp. CB02366]OKJ37007.1 GntR family transcriptional regulator [Streptomyces sp. CB02366]TVP36146.1 GntR family transcriptional regulator [Streptomyces griseus subsp. griseus]WSS55187.1 GntR family transcriptional regulator [Streptomyces sp. NBC_01178]
MPRDKSYLKVADELRARVRAGEWAVGEKLPSRARFAEEFGVGRSVAQRAMEHLIVEGILEGRAGSGTYVRRPRERRRMIRSRHSEQRGAGPFASNMKELDHEAEWECTSAARVPATEDIAERLAIEPGDPCVVTDYEFLADGMPVQLAKSWEPMAITDGTPVLLPEMGPRGKIGVVERMRSIGVDIATGIELVRPARATREQANLLGISVGDLVIAIERTYFDDEGRPVETADIVVPDIRWEIAYEIRVKRPGS